MRIEENDILARVFVGETQKHKGKLLYEEIIFKAKELNLAGATVVKGIMGFGADKNIHTSKILDLTENLPIIIEIIDKEEKINLLLPFLDEIIDKGFVTLEKVHAYKYRKDC